MPTGYKLTQEEIIARFHAAHGDRYDYSLVNFKKVDDKVIVICRVHGKFSITPKHHYNGHGCPFCAGKKHSMEWAIQRSKEVHGNKFEYLPFDFKNNKSQMNIICHIHGIFHRTVQQHVNEKNGCPKCCKTTKMTHSDFLNKAQAVHGDKYDYLDKYEKATKPIRVRCKKHDYIFRPAPADHLRGSGCPICGREKTESAKRLTLEEFIRRSNSVHNNKYDYSKAEYINGRVKTTIICPIHGEFQQTPEMHMAGHGCPKCGGTYRFTTESFKKRFIAKFGNRFNLSEVEYKNSETPIILTCEKGHRTKRSPNEILNSKYGCLVCGNIAKGKSLNLSTEEFVERARKVHGDYYDYSKVNYIGCRNKVIIICPIHGAFYQKPMRHIQKGGCPICGKERIKQSHKDTKESFILKSRQVHGYKYDYSSCVYINSTHKVDIICPIHGTFKQMPIAHTQGHGCPKCNESKGEKSIRAWLDKHNIDYISQYRIDLPLALFSRIHLRIDFYIPCYNLFIEFNGEQHYKFMPFFHRKEGDFILQQDRDLRLREYCKDYGVRLIEISYIDIDNINKILDKEIGAIL